MDPQGNADAALSTSQDHKSTSQTSVKDSEAVTNQRHGEKPQVAWKAPDLYLRSTQATHLGTMSSDSAPTTSRNEKANNHDYFGPHAARPASASATRSPSKSSRTMGHVSGFPPPATHAQDDTNQTIRRIPSIRADKTRGRTFTHSKSSSTSLIPPKSPNDELPVYPDQAFSALQHQLDGSRITPIIKPRSSNRSPSLLNTDVAPARSSRGRSDRPATSRTEELTPITSPGLFSPSPSRTNVSDLSGDDHSRSSSPRLHPMQKSVPKTTHVAEVDRDLYSGNKLINEYEFVNEIGRGRHGKVKLGRRMGEGWYVAIKIVPRISQNRLVPKIATDGVKREIAILKRARHENIVGLYEVIDDPTLKKVYLVLEYVEKGEIRWRKNAPNEILAINKVRYEREKAGFEQSLIPAQNDQVAVDLARRRHEQRNVREFSGAQTPLANWSLEHTQDHDDDSSSSDLSGALSRHVTDDISLSHSSSADDSRQPLDAYLAGSMYGPYTMEDSFFRNRATSVADSTISHMSSEFNLSLDDQDGYVPALTYREIRRTMRDCAQGIEFLHSLGIIHRDIKPMNLLVTADGRVKISDFSVSYLGRPVSDEEEARTVDDDPQPLDDERELAKTVGTPAFWAPEICYDGSDPAQAAIFEHEGKPRITPVLDLWSLGVSLYAMVYAKLPFYEEGGLSIYQAICSTQPFLPKSRLKPVDATTEEYRTRSTESMNSNKRLDYELVFEEVPAAARDLITRLLVKDPTKRMTVQQLMEHPWVTLDIENPSKWAATTSPEKKEKASDILAVGEKEISRAVVKGSLLEKGIAAVKGLADTLLGRKDSRKRTTSNAASANISNESIASLSNSSGSTVGRGDEEPRRRSLRGDEILPALKASRETTEHPLAQSQTASPDARANATSYFVASQSNKVASTGASLQAGIDPRPHGPARTISAADSVKTIKASQPIRRPALLDHTEETETSNLLNAATNSLNYIADAASQTAKRLTGVSTWEREPTSASESSLSSVQSSETDVRAQPSLAVSTASAHGDLQTPEALQSPPLSQEQREPPLLSPISPNSAARHAKFQPPESSKAAFAEALEVNRRRYIQENRIAKEKKLEEDELRNNPDDCPPSPDDLGVNPTLPSASTLASSDGPSSSGVSQSISNLSIGVISSASSPPTDFLLRDEQSTKSAGYNDDVPDFMRTTDTITSYDRIPVATGAPLEEMTHANEDNDEDDVDYDDDDSEDDGIVMGGPKRT